MLSGFCIPGEKDASLAQTSLHIPLRKNKKQFNISRLTKIQKREIRLTGLSEGHLLLQAYKLKIK